MLCKSLIFGPCDSFCQVMCVREESQTKNVTTSGKNPKGGEISAENRKVQISKPDQIRFQYKTQIQPLTIQVLKGI